MGFFHALMTLLGFDAQGSDGTRLKPHNANRFLGFFAISIAAILDTVQRAIDLGNQLAFPVPSAQFNGSLGLDRRAIGDIRSRLGILLQILNCGLRLDLNMSSPPICFCYRQVEG